ncbi:unnamed protein product [Hymenolepis diminuta]|uniref:Protein kinase domain-containing protein n=1 Tax=Hymenolepis diminuta TaxID=6216 RepID=A0A3P6ZD59_HYMDI|nr:unnamed protein product [Hymenolepis diminuta]
MRECVLRGSYRVPFYMSHECEMLLRKMLVLNPTKRASLLEIMKDKWLNTTFEDSTLQPYKEDLPNYNDPERIRKLVIPHLFSVILVHSVHSFNIFLNYPEIRLGVT